MTKHEEFVNEFKKQLLANSSNQQNFLVEIVNDFCERNKLKGIDGAIGLVKLVGNSCNNFKDPIYREKNKGLIKSFGELAFLLWAFNKFNRNDLPDKVARNMEVGGNIGDTTAYTNCETANHFRSLESQLNVGLRLLEAGIKFKCGVDGEPDYILEDIVIEVKATASKVGLVQACLKANQQIHKINQKGKLYCGIILLFLDHMVIRNMVSTSSLELASPIPNIITSLLPHKNEINTIGILCDYIDWESDDSSVVQAFYLKGLNIENKIKLERVINFLTDGSGRNLMNENFSKTPFDYSKPMVINPTTDGIKFYNENWQEPI